MVWRRQSIDIYDDEETMAYVIAPQPIPTLGVEGTTDLFPVNRIFCVGRNYADHAREMGAIPIESRHSFS